MSSAHSPIFPSLHLRHSSFSNPSVALPKSQFFLQPFFRFSYVTGSSLTSPGDLPYIIKINYHEFTNITILPKFTLSCICPHHLINKCNHEFRDYSFELACSIRIHCLVDSECFVTMNKIEVKILLLYRVIQILPRQQTAVARGLAWPARRFTGRQTAAAPKHSLCFSVTVIPVIL